MATNPLTTPSSEPTSPRPLWQVPTFLLGLLVLGGVLLVRPLWRNSVSLASVRLSDARKMLDRRDADLKRVEALARGYLDHAGPTGERAAEAHFVLGSTLARSAHALLAGDAAAQWRKARTHLEQAERLGVPEQDAELLQFRLGLCGFYTDEAPDVVVGRVMRTVELADDKVEGYRVLAESYLKLPKPDLEAALKANERLRQLPLVGEDVLGPARVQAGELLLKLKRSADARGVLVNVSKDSAPAVRDRARFLLARSHQDEGDYAEAARLWSQTLKDTAQPPADPGAVLYNLGLCYRRSDQPREAAGAWERCLKVAKGDGVAAAALGLAEVRLAEIAPETAVEAFEKAVEGLSGPDDWKNALVDRDKARALFEQGIQAYRDKRDHALAHRLAKAFEKLAPPERGVLLRAETAADWAAALSAKAKSAKDPAAAKKLEEEAIALSRLSGAAYEEAAAKVKEPARQAERLWLAAASHLQGQDVTRAVTALERFLQLGGHAEERTGEAWYLLGESFRWLKDEKAAEGAYRDCVRYRGKFAYRSRYQLSQLELKRGNTGIAAGILEQNLTLLRPDPNPDPEAVEKTLYALGNLHYRRRNYETARSLLEEAVSKFPSSPFALRGRYDLAETYQKLAAQENQNYLRDDKVTKQAREHYQRQHRAWLQKASEQFQELSRLLASGDAAAGGLTAQEQVHVLFSAAECRFDLGEYGEALRLYDQLADRFKDRAERLNALGGSVRCFAAQGEQTKVRQRLDEIRVSLTGVDETTRRQWEQWLSVAGRQ